MTNRERRRVAQSTSLRKGATLLLVVLCMVVLTTILAAMFRHLRISTRQIKQRARKTQATLLAESAIERAVYRMQIETDYRQETWTIPAAELGQRFGGTVDIAVGEAKDGQQLVSVTAAYPASSEFRATVRKSVSVATANRTSDKNGVGDLR